MALLWIANIFFNKMLREVNQNLGPDEKHPLIMAPGKGWGVVREHRRMYPRSPLRFMAGAFSVMGLLVFMISVWKAAGY